MTGKEKRMRKPPQPDHNGTAPISASEAMMTSLRKEVDDWNKGQHANEGSSSARTSMSPIRKRVAQTPISPLASQQASQLGNGERQPFRMFYDGISTKEYAAIRRILGAR